MHYWENTHRSIALYSVGLSFSKVAVISANFSSSGSSLSFIASLNNFVTDSEKLCSLQPCALLLCALQLCAIPPCALQPCALQQYALSFGSFIISLRAKYVNCHCSSFLTKNVTKVHSAANCIKTSHNIWGIATIKCDLLVRIINMP